MAGKGVTQGMNSNTGNLLMYRATIVYPVQIARVDWLSCGVGEHSGELVIKLCSSLSLKCRLVERNGTLPRGSFGTAFHKAIVRLTLAGVSISDIFQRTLYL